MKNLPAVSLDQIFAVDNKRGRERSFRHLRHHLMKNFQKQSTWGEERPIKWLRLEADMKDRIDQKTKKPVKHLTFDEIKELGKQYGMNSKELEACLSYLHSKGDIVWFSDEGLRDVITLDPQWLVDIFKILITPEMFIKKRSCKQDVLNLLASGIVSFSSLEKFWSGNDVEFLVGIMQKFGLILPVGEGEGKKRKFCIPCMLPQKPTSAAENLSLQQMKQAYKSEHRSSHNTLFPLGTFSRLIAACSKVWHIREDEDLCYSNASFGISPGLLLTLTLTHGSSILVLVWCDPTLLDETPLTEILSVRQAVSTGLAACRIPAASHFELLCPHWRPGDVHFSMVKVSEKEAPADGSPAARGHTPLLEPTESICVCHTRPLSHAEFEAGMTRVWLCTLTAAFVCAMHFPIETKFEQDPQLQLD